MGRLGQPEVNGDTRTARGEWGILGQPEVNGDTRTARVNGETASKLYQPIKLLHHS